jgi:hypothetical protein
LPDVDPHARQLPAAPIAHRTGVRPAAATSPAAPAAETWPDATAFRPPPPCTTGVPCQPPERIAPVLQHTKVYNGHDDEVTEALASYVYIADDARFGGWQAYLQRSDDFIRFCCHLHLFEMLSARGGAGETRVVYRWPEDR